MNLYQASYMDINQAKYITIIVKAVNKEDAKNQFREYLIKQGVKVRNTSIKITDYTI